MDYLRIVAKVTPVFNFSYKAEEYIVSEDFIFPSTCLEIKKKAAITTNYFRVTTNENQTDSEKSSKVTDSQILGNNYHFFFESICVCIQNLAFVKFRNKIKVSIDAILFSIIMLELKRSKTFRANMLANFFAQYFRDEKVKTRNLCTVCNKSTVKIHVIVFLNTPKKNVLDYKWNGRIQVMVNEKCELENAMAWLSTLGGAFSALGDTFIECAEKAALISVQQLHIALRLGDPLTLCRCKIYLAMSFLQRGYFSRTKRLIRVLYKFSTEGEGSKDFRLKNMCIAVWNRMKYLKSLKVINEIKAY